MLTSYSSPLILFQFGGEVNEIKIASHLSVWDQLFWPASALLIVRLGTGLKTFKPDTALVQAWTPALKVADCSLCYSLSMGWRFWGGRTGSSQALSEDLSSGLGGQNCNSNSFAATEVTLGNGRILDINSTNQYNYRSKGKIFENAILTLKTQERKHDRLELPNLNSFRNHVCSAIQL